MPDVKVDVPPVQSPKQISFFLWLARITGFLYGIFTLMSISDLFSTIAIKVFLLLGGICSFAAMYSMGQIPSAKQRAATNSK